MKIDILTIFPEFTSSINQYSIIKRAIENKIVEINSIDIREFSKDKHKRVDDYPYGGGPGMIMTIQPLADAIKSVKKENSLVIYLSPRGEKFQQKTAQRLKNYEHIILVCGHYEGIDQRVIENYIDEEISVGDYVVTGGEIPAMMLADSVIRLLPGVLGNEESSLDESFSKDLLEYDQYTRPEEYEGLKVPEVLISGHHKNIEEFRKNSAIKNTKEKRPDLFEKYNKNN